METGCIHKCILLISSPKCEIRTLPVYELVYVQACATDNRLLFTENFTLVYEIKHFPRRSSDSDHVYLKRERFGRCAGLMRLRGTSVSQCANGRI